MSLFFWRDKKRKGRVQGKALDEHEREMLYELMHALDGIELYRRVEAPDDDSPYETALERVQRTAQLMDYFNKDRKIKLSWDVMDVKRNVHEYERSIKNPVGAIE